MSRDITDQYLLTSEPALKILRKPSRNVLRFTGCNFVCDQMRGRVKVDAFPCGQASLDAMPNCRHWYRELGACSCCLNVAITTHVDPFNDGSDEVEFDSFAHYLVHVRQRNQALADERRKNKEIRKRMYHIAAKLLFQQSGKVCCLLH